MSQQTAIITGAGGAIAQHVIVAFEDAGWTLGLIAYDDTELARLQESHSQHVAVQGNLADPAEAQRAIGEAMTALGHVDALLNIAGGFDMAGAVDTDPAQLEAQMDINLRTAFNATRALLPSMLKRGHGFVLGVGAAAAIDGGASVGAYAASKGALVAWLKSVGAELRPHGITVSVMYPMAAVDTPGNRAAMPDVDPQTWIDPAELAATAVHLASRGPRGYVPEARVYPPA
jgi:NAD(P)-dependent dehydrogenase (short-subunit alcohol dehydrogenase family)